MVRQALQSLQKTTFQEESDRIHTASPSRFSQRAQKNVQVQDGVATSSSSLAPLFNNIFRTLCTTWFLFRDMSLWTAFAPNASAPSEKVVRYLVVRCTRLLVVGFSLCALPLIGSHVSREIPCSFHLSPYAHRAHHESVQRQVYLRAFPTMCMLKYLCP